MYGLCSKLVSLIKLVCLYTPVKVTYNIKDTSLVWNMYIFGKLRIRNALRISNFSTEIYVVIYAGKNIGLDEMEPLRDSTLLVWSKPCLQILELVCKWMALQTLAYYGMATITAVKSFVVIKTV